MKIKLKSVIIFLGLILINFSCKKYPQGPSISLRSEVSRLCQNWKLSQYFEDHVDKTTLFMQYKNAFQFNISYPAASVGQQMNIYSETTLPATGAIHTVQKFGTWSGNDDGTILIFREQYIIDNLSQTPINSNEEHYFVILKLYNNSFAVQENLAGHSFEYFFVPQ